MPAALFSLVALVAGLFALGISIYAYGLGRASVPNAIIRSLEDVRTRVLAAEEREGVLRSDMVLWRTEMDGMLEAIDGQLDRVERKRRSTSAAASKIDRQTGGMPPGSDGDLAARARAQGLL